MMEPTRADIRARTAGAGREGWDGGGGVDLRGRRGVKCLVRRRGPRVLVRKVERAAGAEIWEGDFSGCCRGGVGLDCGGGFLGCWMGWVGGALTRMPGRRKARRREVSEKRDLQWAAAAEMVDSSGGGWC